MTAGVGSGVADAHRHLGTLPSWAFYGGPPVNPDTTARANRPAWRFQMA